MGLGKKLAGKTTALAAPSPEAPPAPPAPEPARYLEIDPRRIEPNPDQPRREFNQEALIALAASIGEHGLLEPLLVRLEAGRVILIAGERRQRAAILAGLARVPCTVNHGGDSAVLALVENLHREDLTPLEEAEALSRLQQERGLSLADLAEIARKSVSTVSEIISLASLPAQVKEAAAAQPGRFPRRLLVEMAKEDPSRAVILAQHATSGREVRAEDVRAARRERKAAAKGPAKPKPPASDDGDHLGEITRRVDALFRRAEDLASEMLGINLHHLSPRQRAQAKHGLQPMARALDRIFGHLKQTAKQDKDRWTPERRAKLLGLVHERGAIQARVVMGQEINDDGLPLPPGETEAQLILARQEALA